jgi:hypothetical protein
MINSNGRKLWPWLAAGAVLAVAALLLSAQGRLWICACGRVLFWTSEAWGAATSQHLFDPYALTHVLHGFAFCWLIGWLAPRIPAAWGLTLALALEAAWEVIENSAFVIRRYREATAALGYEGDTVINALGDIIACGLGFALARRIGFGRSLALFALTEIALIFWIKDSLLLNVIMLIYPIEAIKIWQASH